MGLLDIRTVLGDLAAGRISAERIAFLKDRLDAMDREKAELKQEAAELRAENAELDQKLRAQAKAPSQDEFVEASGALFKRKPGGGYHEVVYCPRCRASVRFEPGFEAYLCATCDWGADFKHAGLPQ
jgi:hypothetical protein